MVRQIGDVTYRGKLFACLHVLRKLNTVLVIDSNRGLPFLIAMQFLIMQRAVLRKPLHVFLLFHQVDDFHILGNDLRLKPMFLVVGLAVNIKLL